MLTLKDLSEIKERNNTLRASWVYNAYSKNIESNAEDIPALIEAYEELEKSAKILAIIVMLNLELAIKEGLTSPAIIMALQKAKDFQKRWEDKA